MRKIKFFEDVPQTGDPEAFPPLPQFSTTYFRSRGKPESNKKPSKTVPDMSMSIMEIMVRYSQGRPLHYNSNLSYTGDNLYPDVRTMDLVDIDDAYRAVLDRKAALQAEIDEKRTMRRKETEEAQKAAKAEKDQIIEYLNMKKAEAQQKAD